MACGQALPQTHATRPCWHACPRRTVSVIDEGAVTAAQACTFRGSRGDTARGCGYNGSMLLIVPDRPMHNRRPSHMGCSRWRMVGTCRSSPSVTGSPGEEDEPAAACLASRRQRQQQHRHVGSSGGGMPPDLPAGRHGVCGEWKGGLGAA